MNFPSRVTSLDVPTLYKNTIGIDQWLNDIVTRPFNNQTVNYPPYNVISLDKNNYRLEIACAGFAETDVSVSLDNGTLTISAAKVVETDQDAGEYLHRGISGRQWERSFVLADHVEVKSASMANGILSVELERVLPEALKPRQIPINSK